VAGPSGKMQGFGFCDFDNPVATLRVIRLLNGYEIADKKLLVKVDQKTQELLSDYIKKMKENAKGPLSKNAKKAEMLKNISSGKLNEQENENGSEDGSNNKSTINLLNLELIDENTLKEDRIALCAFELIYKQYEKELQPPVPEIEQQATSEVVKKEEPKNETALSAVEKDKEESKDRERERERDRERERERDRDRDRERDRNRDRDRDRERDRDRDAKLPRVNSSSSSLRSPDRHRNHYEENVCIIGFTLR
jgi:RNA-binding protein 25